MSVEMEQPAAKKPKYSSFESRESTDDYDLFNSMEPSEMRTSGGGDLPDELLLLDEAGSSSGTTGTSQTQAASTSAQQPTTAVTNSQQQQQRVPSSSVGPAPPYATNTGAGGGVGRQPGGHSKPQSVLESLLAPAPNNSNNNNNSMNVSSGSSTNTTNSTGPPVSNSQQQQQSQQQQSGDSGGSSAPYGAPGPHSVPLGQNQIASPQRPPTAPGGPASIPVSYARSPAAQVQQQQQSQMANMMGSPPASMQMGAGRGMPPMQQQGPRSVGSNAPGQQPVSFMNDMDGQQPGGNYVMANGQPGMPPSYQTSTMRGGVPSNYGQRPGPPQHFAQGAAGPRQSNPVMVNGQPGQRQMRPPQQMQHQMVQQQMIRPGYVGGPNQPVGYSQAGGGMGPNGPDQYVQSPQQQMVNGPGGPGMMQRHQSGSDFGSPQPNMHNPQFQPSGPQGPMNPRFTQPNAMHQSPMHNGGAPMSSVAGPMNVSQSGPMPMVSMGGPGPNTSVNGPMHPQYSSPPMSGAPHPNSNNMPPNMSAPGGGPRGMGPGQGGPPPNGPMHMGGVGPMGPGPANGPPGGNPIQQPPNQNPNNPNQPGGQQQPGNQDPEKRRLIQQQLVLLLHAHKCQQREAGNHGQPHNCDLPHCSTMKGVLTHMTNCNDGRMCSFPHCASSRQIISHWKNCTRDDCPVCKPLKQISNDKRGSQALADATQAMLQGANLGPMPNASLAGGGTGSFAPNQFNASYSNGPMANVDVTSPPNQIAPGVEHGGLGPMAGGKGGARPGFNSSMQQPPSISNNSMGVPHSPFNDPQQFTGNLPPPDQPLVAKEWHQNVTRDLRNHLVTKLVKAIFPSPDPSALQDHRLRDLITYARKVEKDMFEQANDREEYYHLLAEKIYKIQKELQEKKTARQQRANATGPGGPMPVQCAAVSGTNSIAHDLSRIDEEGPPNRTVMPGQGGMPMGGYQPQQQMHQQPSVSNAGNGMMGQNGPVTSSANMQFKTEPKHMMEPSTSNISGVQQDDVKPNIKDEPDSRAGSAQSNRPQSAAANKQAPPTPTVKREPEKPKQAVAKKTFSPDELRNCLMPIWDKLERMDEAIPFRVPVDPELLQIEDYFSIVQHPMDLSTIREKLNRGDYKDPWGFCDDMWLMFENAWLYNRRNSRVYKYCTKLSECFEEEIYQVMQDLGYCCGRKLSFTSLPIFCFGQPMCTIARDQNYYCYESSSTTFTVTVTEKYVYCTKCYDNMPEEGINLSEDPNSRDMVPKAQFKLMKNDQIDPEPFIDCTECGRKWHQICALHYDKIFGPNFICPHCRTEKSTPKPDNKFTAKRLRPCELSKFIESRVNNFLSGDPARDQAGEVVIRVLNNCDKEVDVKPLMKQKYCQTGQFPDKFPYRTKAIFAFEVIDGVEVCFFGLHVQEYGSEAPAPNARRVYIAYLDSVHFFQPRQLRTSVYHEILLGYLQYCKNLGYTMAHIWACPPSEGDDYIFHIHPQEQKIPKPKRLQDWYRKMLDKGIVEHTVTDYKDIHTQAHDDRLVTPAQLPYFEGDYWPNVIEDCIRETEAAEAERRAQEAQLNTTDNPDEEDDLYEDGATPTSGTSKKKNQKTSKKKAQKKSATKKKKTGASDVVDKLFTIMEKNKDVFFTIRLTTIQTEQTLGPIKDPDPVMQSDLMDGRDTFLNKARDAHWEFSNLRRAKFSTMCLCHELHMQGKDQFVYTCNNCKGQNARYHCNTCQDFDLCERCYETSTHEHKAEMEKIQSMVDAGDEGASGNAENRREDPTSRNESIQRCIQSLVHACQCRNVHCRRLSCHKMKRVVQHTKVCKKRQQGNCPVCKQLIALCCYHAKHCHDASCQVPFCTNIRQKLAEQKQAQRRQADRMMMRRMIAVHQQSGATGAPGGAGATGMPGAPHGTTPNMSGTPTSGGMMMSSAGPTPTSSQQPMHTTPQQQQPQQQQYMNGPMQQSQQPPQQQRMPMQHNMPPQQQHMHMQGQGGMPPTAMQQRMQQPMQYMQQQQPQGAVMNPPPYPRAQQSVPPQQQQQQQSMMQRSSSMGQWNPDQQNQPMMNGPGGPQQDFMRGAPQQRPGMGGPGQFNGPMSGGPMQQQQQPPPQQMGGQRGPHSDSEVQLVVNQLRQARTPEEREGIIHRLKQNPTLFSQLLSLKERPMMNAQGGQPPQQQPQPGGSGPPQQQQQPGGPMGQQGNWVGPNGPSGDMQQQQQQQYGQPPQQQQQRFAPQQQQQQPQGFNGGQPPNMYQQQGGPPPAQMMRAQQQHQTRSPMPGSQQDPGFR